MKLISTNEVNLGKHIQVNGAKTYKVYGFKPGIEVEVDDNYADQLLAGPFGGVVYFTPEDYKKKFSDSEVEIGGSPAIPEVVEEKIEEVIEEMEKPNLPETLEVEKKAGFTEEELNELEIDDLIGLAKEVGFTTANKGWKKETLISKILGTYSETPIIE